jgi:MFS family permease
MEIRVWPEVGSFIVIGAGAIGCVVAGLIADRVGRTLVTSWAMAISGTCCLVIGLLYGGNPFVLCCRGDLGSDGGG